jgi:hypothetical protein
VFERLGDPLDAADVAAVEIGGEAEFGVAGHLDRLGVGLEAVERGDRAKGLLLGMTMSVVTSVNTVGSKKLRPYAARLLPRIALAPFLTASAMCASTFSTAFMAGKGDGRWSPTGSSRAR